MTMQTDVRLGPVDTDQPVVMVDDDELDIEAACRGLGKSGIANPFVSYASGPAFLEHLAAVEAGKAKLPAVVLLDINMPLTSGFEVLQQLRANPLFAKRPFVTMLTSSNHENDRKLALSGGANDYLTKPQNYREYTEFFSQLFEH